MNRIIKFRIWDKEQKEMRTMQPNWSFSNLNAPEYIALQFTGLFDKNGKEIFEGDIVYIKKDKFGKDKNEVWSVEWDECDGCWVVYNQLNSHRKFVLEDRDCPRVYITEDDYFYPEVKGNVFENKNLLK